MGSPRPTLRQILRPARLWIGGLVLCFLAGLWVVTCLYYLYAVRSNPNLDVQRSTSIQIGEGALRVSDQLNLDPAWVVTKRQPTEWKWGVGKNSQTRSRFDRVLDAPREGKKWHLRVPVWPIAFFWIPLWFAGCYLLERKRMRHLSFPVESGRDIG